MIKIKELRVSENQRYVLVLEGQLTNSRFQ